MTNLTDPVVGVGGFALLSLMIATFFRVTYLQNRREQQNDDRIKALEADKDWCNFRVTKLILACQRGGVEIPDEVWEPPPLPPEPVRRRRWLTRTTEADDGAS